MKVEEVGKKNGYSESLIEGMNQILNKEKYASKESGKWKKRKTDVKVKVKEEKSNRRKELPKS